MPQKIARLGLLCGAVLVGISVASQHGEAHKPITSKYTYNDDVFPILRARCGACHVKGGVAPMSLLTYRDTVPWAESIRAELMSAHMPPWYAEDGYGPVRNAHSLSARELDVLLVWASGGTPQGNASKRLPTVAASTGWPLGEPGLELEMPAPFTLAADKNEDTHEFVLATGTTTDRWVAAVDLLPGTPAIVRDALVVVKAPDDKDSPADAEGDAADRVLLVWMPGGESAAAPAGAGFRLPAGASLVVRIHYRKTWQYEGKALADRSTVGLYFAQAPSPRELRRVTLTSRPIQAADRSVTFSHRIDADLEAVALTPETLQPGVKLDVTAVKANGTRVPLIRVTTRPHWNRRYWLERPVALPRGSRIDVTATPTGPDRNPLTDAPATGAAGSPDQPPARVAIGVDVLRREGATQSQR